MKDREPEKQSILRRPLTAFLATVQDGRFLKFVFLGMLGLTVGTLGMDFQQMVANAPEMTPGSQRLEPAPMSLPKPGDQTRPYLPRTMPLGPQRETPRLPGYFGPLNSEVMAQPMKFYVGSGGRVSGIGTIAPGTSKRFAAFLEENAKQVTTLHLHSPGGSVSDALAMSKLARAEGINTRVPANAYCASSCPIVLSGGLYRSAGKNAWVGVHQIYAPPPSSGTLQRGMSDAQSVSAVVQDVLVEHGVDPKVWIYAMRTPSAELYVFRAAQLSRLNLANGRIARTLPSPRPQPAEG